MKTVASGSAVAAPRLTAKLIEHYLRQADPQQRGREADRRELLDVLSPGERNIFSAIVRGLSNVEISAELVLAPPTIKPHINSIFANWTSATACTPSSSATNSA